MRPGYVYRNALSVWPFYVFVVLRQTLQAHHRVLPIGVTIVVANLVNVALNYVWIFGHFGFPAMGVLGSAWATTVSRWLMAAMLLALGWRTLKPYLARRRAESARRAPARAHAEARAADRRADDARGRRVQHHGAADGLARRRAGRGAPDRAESRVADVHGAARRVVGRGRHRRPRRRPRRPRGRAALDGRVAGRRRRLHAVHGRCCSSLRPSRSPGLYTRDATVLALAALLLPIAGVFQVFDGLQVVAIGLLRGLGDTRMPMIVNVVGFWCIGMPVSLWLGFGLDYGAVGSLVGARRGPRHRRRVPDRARAPARAARPRRASSSTSTRRRRCRPTLRSSIDLRPQRRALRASCLNGSLARLVGSPPRIARVRSYRRADAGPWCWPDPCRESCRLSSFALA